MDTLVYRVVNNSFQIYIQLKQKEHVENGFNFENKSSDEKKNVLNKNNTQYFEADDVRNISKKESILRAIISLPLKYIKFIFIYVSDTFIFTIQELFNTII